MYLDPGFGSMIIQLIIAFIAACGAYYVGFKENYSLSLPEKITSTNRKQITLTGKIKMTRIEYSSFRDPSGFVYYKDDKIIRQINKNYQTQYDHLINSGLYQILVLNQYLIEHKKSVDKAEDTNAYCLIEPEVVPFISYPYEWSFAQLKDAALTILKIQKHAMEFGMMLKDASAYNIQFLKNVPKLIDTLSFDFYEEGSPWIAYGQFCRHFLAPLFLMSKVDIRLSQLLRIYIDGVPLNLASTLLKGKGGFAAKQHIHWHARIIKKHSDDGRVIEKEKIRKINISKNNLIALIDSLINIVEHISINDIKTEWMDYYDNTNYSEIAFTNKKDIITDIVKKNNFKNIWDFGSNDGLFSRIAILNGATHAVAFDVDPIAVERNYLKAKKSHENILPLILDLTNPSPAIGFSNLERVTVGMRQRPDCIIALALTHHLAISNNLPFSKIAEWFSSLSDNLIIEFIPKEDSQVQILLKTRKDIFVNYNKTEFEREFGKYYNRISHENVEDSCRTIYYYSMKKGNHDERYK